MSTLYIKNLSTNNTSIVKYYDDAEHKGVETYRTVDFKLTSDGLIGDAITVGYKSRGYNKLSHCKPDAYVYLANGQKIKVNITSTTEQFTQLPTTITFLRCEIYTGDFVNANMFGFAITLDKSTVSNGCFELGNNNKILNSLSICVGNTNRMTGTYGVCYGSGNTLYANDTTCIGDSNTIVDFGYTISLSMTDRYNSYSSDIMKLTNSTPLINTQRVNNMLETEIFTTVKFYMIKSNLINSSSAYYYAVDLVNYENKVDNYPPSTNQIIHHSLESGASPTRLGNIITQSMTITDEEDNPIIVNPVHNPTVYITTGSNTVILTYSTGQLTNSTFNISKGGLLTILKTAVPLNSIITIIGLKIKIFSSFLNKTNKIVGSYNNMTGQNMSVLGTMNNFRSLLFNNLSVIGNDNVSSVASSEKNPSEDIQIIGNRNFINSNNTGLSLLGCNDITVNRTTTDLTIVGGSSGLLSSRAQNNSIFLSKLAISSGFAYNFREQTTTPFNVLSSDDIILFNIGISGGFIAINLINGVIAGKKIKVLFTLPSNYFNPIDKTLSIAIVTASGTNSIVFYRSSNTAAHDTTISNGDSYIMNFNNTTLLLRSIDFLSLGGDRWHASINYT